MTALNEITIAYIDPGAGAMMLQWGLAALIGGALFFRAKFMALIRFVFRRGRSDNDPEAGTQPPGRTLDPP